jgi:uncharacterized protein YndB with AHSA1/START domain
VPTARRSRIIAAPAEELWDLIRDPHHLPRWWPRVSRVENVTLTGTGEAHAFTEVLKSPKGKVVRADFQLLEADDRAHRVKWEQRLEGTPFDRLLQSAETEVWLQDHSESYPSAGARRASADGGSGEGATKVTIELRQALNGLFPRFGGYMVRRAARATLDEALAGLERISV